MIRMWAALALLWSSFVLGIGSTRLNLFRLRTLLAFVVLLAIIILVRAWVRGWRPGRPTPALLGLLGLHALLIVIGSLHYPPAALPFALASAALLTGVGWLIWVEMRARPAEPAATAFDSPFPLAFAGCLTVAAILAIGFRYANGAPLVAAWDELLFQIQARALSGRAADYVVDAEVVSAFRLPWVDYTGETLVPRSAAGWPLLLAAAERIGVARWLGLGLTLLNVGLTAAAGRRLFGVQGGLLATAFVAFNPLILRFGPTYAGHAATLTLLLCALLLMLSALERPAGGARRLASVVGAGALMGAALITRPVGAAAMIAGMLTWLHFRAPAPRGDMLRLALPRLAIGATPVIATVGLAYGVPLGWPLRWSHGELFAGALPARDPDVLFAGVSEAMKAGWFSFGALGLLPLAGFLLMSGVGLRPHVVAAFLILPIVSIALTGGTIDTYHDLAPFLAFAFAWSILELRRRDASLARAAGAFALCGALATSVMLLYSMGRFDTQPAELHERVMDARARWGQLLIFVPIGTPDHVTAKLWSYNVDGVRGPVVVALETNPVTNRQVLERLNGRQVLLLRQVAEGDWRLEPLIWYLSPEHHQAFLPRLGRIGG